MKAAAGQVWSGIGIHIIDMVHPPGISMPPFMDRQKYKVAPVQARNARVATA
jgi:hypothetical protein